MQITVLPITVTTLNWNQFLTATQSVLKRSMSASLDKRSVADRGLASAIAAFGEFQCQGTDYLQVLRDAGSLLKHFSVSFLIVCDDETLLLELVGDGDIKIILSDETPKLCIITASLESWRTTLINFACQRATHAQRHLADELLSAFDRLGLGKLWDNYSRARRDQELILTEKR